MKFKGNLLFIFRLSFLFVFFPELSSLKAQKQFKEIHFSSSHTSFPDTARNNGHDYRNAHYSFADHYNDSSVLVIVPSHFQESKNTDLIFWFHGWNNNIDTAVKEYDLQKQIEATERNLILVLPETAYNAPDSYGGKLEKSNEFSKLIKDVMLRLKKQKLVPERAKTGTIILAGHSGAYRVMASILKNGGADVKEVYLFDALYAMNDDFINWISVNPDHRFINIYTDSGGTAAMSRDMMFELESRKIPFKSIEEKDMDTTPWQDTNILFIHSKREHNRIINDPNRFMQFLNSSKK